MRKRLKLPDKVKSEVVEKRQMKNNKRQQDN
jgi:hypothetical protein